MPSTIINIDDGEFSSIEIQDSTEEFLEILNREIKLTNVFRPYVYAYDNGDDFHVIFQALPLI